jgi:site-specific recombinase XerD
LLAEATAGFLDYLKTYRRSSPATLVAYAADLHRLQEFVASTGLPTSVPQLTARHLQAYAFSLRDAAPASVSRSLNVISSLFAYLERQGVVSCNPVREVERPRLPEKLPRAPSLSAVQALVGAASTARDRSMVLLMSCCGLRRSELLDLQTGDVSADLTELVVRQGKGARDRVVPMSRQVQEALRAYLVQRGDQPGPLFRTRSGTRLGCTGFYRVFHKLLKRAGLAESAITPHALRHFCATALLRGHADIETVRTILGHRDVRTTQRYLHADAASSREAVERLPILTPDASVTPSALEVACYE